METKHTEREVEEAVPNETSPRAGPTGAAVANASPRTVCSALNRLIVAGRGEIATLDAAARIVDGAERRARLREQVQRRLTFRRDLAAAVTALDGVPAAHAAVGARLAAVGRRFRELLIGPHEGDAYAACAQATATAAAVYAKALHLGLPPDVTFGLERQYLEVEWDRSELRRLRWGASLAPVAGPSLFAQTERPKASAPSDADDARALDVWSEEGGPGPARSSSAKTGGGSAEAMH